MEWVEIKTKDQKRGQDHVLAVPGGLLFRHIHYPYEEGSTSSASVVFLKMGVKTADAFIRNNRVVRPDAEPYRGGHR